MNRNWPYQFGWLFWTHSQTVPKWWIGSCQLRLGFDAIGRTEARGIEWKIRTANDKVDPSKFTYRLGHCFTKLLRLSNICFRRNTSSAGCFRELFSRLCKAIRAWTRTVQNSHISMTFRVSTYFLPTMTAFAPCRICKGLAHDSSRVGKVHIPQTRSYSCKYRSHLRYRREPFR